MPTKHFTNKARAAIEFAEYEARCLNQNIIGTEIILLGLIGERTGVAAKVLKSMGINLKNARIEVEKITGWKSQQRSPLGWVYEFTLAFFLMSPAPPTYSYTPKVMRILDLSYEEPRQVSTGHLLSALIQEEEGLACIVLENLGADLLSMRQALQSDRALEDPESDEPRGWRWYLRCALLGFIVCCICFFLFFLVAPLVTLFNVILKINDLRKTRVLR